MSKPRRKQHSNKIKQTKRGRGFLNTLINKLPFELHLPGYNFCGPGTNLEKRLIRGDKGINPLDNACKDHDISYSQSNDINTRHSADKLLAEKALARFNAPNASFGEKTSALGIAAAMKVKRKLGMGLKKRRKPIKKRRVGRGMSLSKAISKARKGIMGKQFKSLNDSIKTALKSIGKRGKFVNSKTRVIPIPKTGGVLPLIPIFAGLSALGALGGGAAGIAKAINDARSAKEKLSEAKRHNQMMESIAIGKKGSGLFLKPYKTGCGLFLKPYSKNC